MSHVQSCILVWLEKWLITCKMLHTSHVQSCILMLTTACQCHIWSVLWMIMVVVIVEVAFVVVVVVVVVCDFANSISSSGSSSSSNNSSDSNCCYGYGNNNGGVVVVRAAAAAATFIAAATVAVVVVIVVVPAVSFPISSSFSSSWRSQSTQSRPLWRGIMLSSPAPVYSHRVWSSGKCWQATCLLL